MLRESRQDGLAEMWRELERVCCGPATDALVRILEQHEQARLKPTRA
jgi:hypothetical protein